jgi:S-formylglutathione hydrolase
MFRFALFFASFAVFAGQRPPDRTIPESASPHAETSGRIVSDTFLSRSLGSNLLGDAADRSILVYLPPTYDRNPAKRYPVIYLLHGYGHDPRQWMSGRFQGMNLAEAMDRLIADGRTGEMIVVMPNARNRYHGSHYVNSEVTRRWADAIARELVAYGGIH